MTDAFERERDRLFGLAYRMLGDVGDAEDVVQDAWLRWAGVDATTIDNPAAYLTTVVTRLAIDRLGSARARRESYVGPWLPEPLPDDARSPEDHVELAESLTMGFLSLLERLNPTERAVLLLHDVFGFDHTELATMVNRTPANCRQILHRARAHLGERPRFAPPLRAQAEQLAQRFLEAVANGDVAAAAATLSADVVMLSDGGGVVSAATVPVRGAHRVATFFTKLARQQPEDLTATPRWANGQAGVLLRSGGQPISLMLFAIEGDLIGSIHVVRNPAKLVRLT